MIVDGVKVCTRCGGKGPFNKNNKEDDGLSRYCRECMRKTQAAYRAEHPDLMKAYDKKSYQKHSSERLVSKSAWRKANKSKVKMTKRKWEKQNPDKVKAMCKRKAPRRAYNERLRYAADPSKKAASHKKWREAHPEREKAVRLRRRARKLNANGAASGEQIAARIELFGGVCAYCRIRPYRDVDHVISLVAGGTNWPANLRPSCKTCNSRKGTTTWRHVTFGSPI